MAPTTKVGRNEPCPCGSGKKHKSCCGVRKRGLSNVQLLVVAAVVVVVLLLFASAYNAASKNTRPICPPGQSWSAAHGHCH